MRITKLGHACVLFAEGDDCLVVDPGSLSADLGTPAGVRAVVATHAHGDHVTSAQVEALVAANPELTVFGPDEVAGAAGCTTFQSVAGGEVVVIGAFSLRFFGSRHAPVRHGQPDVANVGVLVNETVFCPGDSFAVPDFDIPVLALPTSGPWLKTAEAADFLEAVRPRAWFATHDAFLSETGRYGTNRFLSETAAPYSTFTALADGETVEV